MAETSMATDVDQLQRRVAELESERKQLVTVLEILEGIADSTHFVDIMQTITQKLGDLYGLDRCSIYLAERRGATARLVATFEDPTIRDWIVDLDNYPELKRALRSGETVFIPDAASDPNLKHIKGALTKRGAKSITVVPISWRGAVIGAIFLRTFRDSPTFTDQDLRFCRIIGSLTARALRNAYRYERLEQRYATSAGDARRANLERVALLGFVRRLMDSYGSRDEWWDEDLLSARAHQELDRLTDVALTVIREEGKER